MNDAREATSTLLSGASEALYASWTAAWRLVQGAVGLTPAQSALAQFAFVILAFLVVRDQVWRSARRRRAAFVGAQVEAVMGTVMDLAGAVGATDARVDYDNLRPRATVTFTFPGGGVVVGHAEARDVAAACRHAAEAAADVARRDRDTRAGRASEPVVKSRPPPPRFSPESPWYVVLGVPANADKAAVREAFRGLSKRHHPDVGGSASVMSEVGRAKREADGR